MTLMMETIQIQTPPKDDEFDSSEASIATDAIEEEQAPKESESEPEARDAEIVVETDKHEPEDENGRENDNSSLSSDHELDPDAENSKSDIKVKKSKSTRPDGQEAVKLGDIEGIKARVDKRLGNDEILKLIHRLLFKRPGTAHEVKKNIRDFSGFKFSDNTSRQGVHDRIVKLMVAQLKEINGLFGLQVSGSKDSLVDALVDFLHSPWDTKSKKRSSGKVKSLTKKKSTEKVKPSKKRKVSPVEDEDRDEHTPEEDNSEEEASPPKKKAKITSSQKAKPRKVLSKPRISSPVDSSDDNLPLRPTVSDSDVKAAIRDFLEGQDFSKLTKGMVKDALRGKFGDYIVKAKREVIAKGIQEGLEG